MLPYATWLSTSGQFPLAGPCYTKQADSIEVSLATLSTAEQRVANGEMLGLSLVLEEAQEQMVSFLAYFKTMQLLVLETHGSDKVLAAGLSYSCFL